MDYLDEPTIEAIEEEIAGRLIEKFEIDLQTLLFDATNFDTYIDTQTDCDLAQRGHAKSKRKDLRIIGLALLVSTDFHVPLLWHVYPGNQNDAAMFGSLTDRLVARYRQFAKNCNDITLVFDGGNISKDNMHKINCSDYHFITSLTLTHHKDLLKVPLRQYQSFFEPRLSGTTAYRTTKEIWGEKYTVVVTRSETLLAGQLAGIHSALKKKRAALSELKTKLHRSQKPGAKGKGYTIESLKNKLDTIACGQYIREILKTEIVQSSDKLDFKFWTDQGTFKEVKRTRLGKRILCTDNHDWSTEQIILESRAQSIIEDAFKRMKDPHWVTFCPPFHWTEKKLRVHAFYCVMALTLTSLLQRKAAQAGIQLTIPALLEQLSDVTEVINLYASQPGRGRLRAEYVLSERSALQDKLCRIFDVYKLAHS
jgi:transposase